MKAAGFRFIIYRLERAAGVAKNPGHLALTLFDATHTGHSGDGMLIERHNLLPSHQ
jgi:hypothetical protein